MSPNVVGCDDVKKNISASRICGKCDKAIFFMTHRYFVIICLCWGIAGCTAITKVSQTKEQGPEKADPAKWKLTEFLISFWGCPEDDISAKTIVNSGFNTVMCPAEKLDLCSRHNLKGLLTCDWQTAQKLANHPDVWGYYVFDEPMRKNVEYEDLLVKVRAFQKAESYRPTYINLNGEDNLEEFIEIIQPRILSYDHYQWWFGREKYFILLEKFRKHSLEANIPFIVWVEACAQPHWIYPEDNAQKIRQSVYCSLAYGAKGIQWWSWSPSNKDAAAINTELKHLGPILIQLTSTKVYHTNPIPKGTVELPTDCWVQTDTGNFLLGFFQNQRQYNYLMVVNRDHRKEQTLTLKIIDPIKTVKKFNKEKNNWMTIPLKKLGIGYQIEINLGAGDGELLIFNNSN